MRRIQTGLILVAVAAAVFVWQFNLQDPSESQATPPISVSETGPTRIESQLAPVAKLIGMFEREEEGAILIESAGRGNVNVQKEALGELANRVRSLRQPDGRIFVAVYFMDGTRSEFAFIGNQLRKEHHPDGEKRLMVGVTSAGQGRAFIDLEIGHEFRFDLETGRFEYGSFTHRESHEK